MGSTVTSELLQVDGIVYSVHPGPVDRVAQLDGAPVHPEPPATELQHLRHERQRLQLAIAVQRGEDLLLAAHLDELTDA
jgi:hypothetical protein